jgi:redox-sensitive bicupin YhaK (pirin superfamily)
LSIRPVKKLIKSKPTLEGAGVHLRRAFGFGNTSDFDPFLLLDDFRNDVPDDYLAGFRTVASRPSPTFSREPSSMATAWATAEPSRLATFNG